MSVHNLQYGLYGLTTYTCHIMGPSSISKYHAWSHTGRRGGLEMIKTDQTQYGVWSKGVVGLQRITLHQNWEGNSPGDAKKWSWDTCTATYFWLNTFNIDVPVEQRLYHDNIREQEYNHCVVAQYFPFEIVYILCHMIILFYSILFQYSLLLIQWVVWQFT